MPPRSPRSILFTVPFVAAMSASITGCQFFDVFEDKTTLAELAPQNAQVKVDLDAEPMVHLALEASPKGCEAITDDVEAKVDDRPMDLFTKGGEQPVKGSWVCGAPTFRRALSPSELGGARTHFEVADETATISVEFDDLLVPRTLEINAPNNRIDPGEELAIDWSVPSDELDPDTLDVTFSYNDADLELAAPPQVRLEGTTLFVKVAPGSPAGKGTLSVSVEAHVPAVVCNGAPKCEGVVTVTTATDLEVGKAG